MLLTLLATAMVMVLLASVSASPAPAILAVSVDPPDLRSGETVTAVVQTNDEATKVVAHVHHHALAIPEVSRGMFRGSAVVPRIPRFIHFHIPVTFVATNADGATTEETVSLAVN